MAYVDSNITTFVYFPDYLSAYYKIATFRNPLKGADVASENYFPLGLPKYENKPIDGIQLFSKIEQLPPGRQQVLLIKDKNNLFIYSNKLSVFRLDEFKLNGSRFIKQLSHSGISTKIFNNDNKSNSTDVFATVIVRYPILVENLKLTRKIANLTKAVLITGETGTGKDLLAHYIHLVGNRRRGPFHIVNCSAINQALFESEFFGHRKGSYTDAYENMDGHLLKKLRYDGIIFVLA